MSDRGSHDPRVKALEEAMQTLLEIEDLVRQGRLRLPYRPRTFTTCYNLLHEIAEALRKG